ncbi:MAG: cytochrome c oxidase assembly protein [Gammaproteobacteria bacterium]|nr:cytochrome c oxidase assembly protein [Gammaproteobacteria bacterium]
MKNKTDINNKASTGKHRRLGVTLAAVVFVMFGFAFAMVPLYQLYCSITGSNSIANNSGRVTAEQYRSDNVNQQRTVTVEFDVTLNNDIPFSVNPALKSIKVHPGEAITTAYIVKNLSNGTIITQAVPGITPWQATAYFHKTECFCFSQQTLLAEEEKEMGLRFMVDADLPEDIEVLTLSYTFMNTERDTKSVTDITQAGN